MCAYQADLGWRKVVGMICSLLRHGPSSCRTVLIARGFVTPPMIASVALFEFRKRSRASIKSARSTRATIFGRAGGRTAVRKVAKESRGDRAVSNCCR